MNDDLVLALAKRVGIASLIIILFMALAFTSPKPIILGYVFGTLISLLTFKLIDNTINKAINMPPSRAKSYSISHYLGRYVIYLVVLLIGAKADYLNLLSTLVGLLMVKFVIIASAIFNIDN